MLTDLPGSGYVWSLPDVPDGLRLLGAGYRGDPPEPTGSARDREFRLVAEAPGRRDLRFELRRTWEPAPIEQRTWHIDARKP